MKTAQITIGLEPIHAKKLLGGACCQLSPAHLAGQSGEPLTITVRKPVATKINRAKKNGKAMRMSLKDIEELEGGDIREFLQRLKAGLQKAGRVYQEKLKPILGPVVKEGVRTLAERGREALKVAAPKVEAALPSTDLAVEQLGRLTGAYGMMPMVPMYGGAMMSYPQNYSYFLPTMNQAFAPVQQWAGFGVPPQWVEKAEKKQVKGASFKALGGSFASIG